MPRSLELQPGPAAPGPGASATRRSRVGLDRFELAVLAALATVSVWVLALDVWQVVVQNRVWTGTDGLFLVDQMQYLAWIGSASHHVLAANRFVLHPTPADYFQPGVAISGAVAAAGVAPWVSYLLWKPVAVLAIFFAMRAFARRTLEGTAARRAALVLGLFFGSFTVIYGAFGTLGDLWPGFLTWGYPYAVVAIAAMVFGLLIYDRARSRGAVAWTPALLGALASSLHPWQGETMILIVLSAEALAWRRSRPALDRRRLLLPAVTVVGTALPLLYYLVLGRTDTSWRLAREASRHAFSLWTIVLALAPLLPAAALAYRRRDTSFIGLATRAWPVAALVIYFLSGTVLSATPLHAFNGISVPLSALAVEGVLGVSWRRIPRPSVAAWLLIAAFTIPALAFELYNAHKLVTPSAENIAAGNSNFITHDELRALQYLAADPQPGGVLTRSYLGTVVPAKTGRRTYVGDCLWSEPNCFGRVAAAQYLLETGVGTTKGAVGSPSMTPAAARAFVLSSGAKFVLSDCESNPGLAEVLAPILVSVHRFGCAGVYVVAPRA